MGQLLTCFRGQAAMAGDGLNASINYTPPNVVQPQESEMDNLVRIGGNTGTDLVRQ